MKASVWGSDGFEKLRKSTAVAESDVLEPRPQNEGERDGSFGALTKSYGRKR